MPYIDKCSKNRVSDLTDEATRAAVLAFLKTLGPDSPAPVSPPGTPTGAVCDGCHLPIVISQHYLRVVAFVETAGLEGAFPAPTVVWSGLFDQPWCGGRALAIAGVADPVLFDVFGR